MSHIFGHVLVLASLAAVVYWTGVALHRLLPVPYLRSLARWILGLTFWSLGLFVLAAFGALTPLGLGFLAATASALSMSLLVIRRSDSTSPITEPADRESWLALLLCAIVALPLLLIALGPTRSWDAEVYHLSLPRLYLEHGGFRPVEMNVYSQWPQGVELWFAVAMLARNFMTAKAVHWGFGLLVLWALILGSRQAISPNQPRNGRQRGYWLWAGVAGLLFLVNDVVLFEMRVAYVDLALAFFLLAQFLFLHRAGEEIADSEHRRSYLALAGLSAGLAAGVKLTGLPLALLLCLVFVPRLLREARQHGGRQTAVLLLPFFATLAVPALIWPAKTFAGTGNPFYPLAWNLFGGADWSAALSEQLTAWQQGMGMGRSPVDYLLLLPRVILFGDQGYAHFDGAIHGLWLFLLPLILWSARGCPLALRALSGAGLMFLFWALSAQQMRFLIPALALVCLAAGAAAGQRFADLPNRPRRLAQIAYMSAVLIALAWGSTYPKLLSTAINHARIFAAGPVDPQATEPAVSRRIDQLPADAKLLLLGTNQRFSVRRELIADSFFEASQIGLWLGDSSSPQQTLARLRERRITHLLVRKRPPVYPPSVIELLRQSQWLRPLHNDQNHLLLELRPAP